MDRHIAIYFIIALLIGSAVAMCTDLAHAHDIYRDWKPPNNPSTSCCNDSDCRPTRAYLDDLGRWRAWDGSMWLVVPSERVLPADFAKDGRSHLCEKGGFVYCFTPAEPRI